MLPPGWSWLDDLGDGVNCFVFFLSFENPWRLLARCWNDEKFLAQLLLGWNYKARGHICCDPPMRVSPDATQTIAEIDDAHSCRVWNIVEGNMKDGGDWKVLQGSRDEVLLG